jgi:hypothetical protein
MRIYVSMNIRMWRGEGNDKIKNYVTCVEIVGRKAIQLLQPERSESSTQKDLAVDYRQAEDNLLRNDTVNC